MIACIPWTVMMGVLGAIGAAICRPPAQTTQKAQLIVQGLQGHWREHNYAWRRADQVLHAEKRDTFTYQIVCTDVSTGKRRNLAVLRRDPGPYPWYLSPEGDWLLYHDGQDPQRWVASHIRTGRRLEWPYVPHEVSASPTACWLPSGQRWIEITMFRRSTIGRIYSITKPDKVDTFEIPGLSFRGGIIGVIRQTELLIWTGSDRMEPHAEFLTIRLMKARGRYQRYTVPYPQGAWPVAITVDPGGKRLAWGFWVKHEPRGRRLLPCPPVSEGEKPGVWVVFYVSDTKGRHLRPIGHFQRHPWVVPDEPVDLAWTLRGDRLSFTRGDALYTFPVP